MVIGTFGRVWTVITYFPTHLVQISPERNLAIDHKA